MIKLFPAFEAEENVGFDHYLSQINEKPSSEERKINLIDWNEAEQIILIAGIPPGSLMNLSCTVNNYYLPDTVEKKLEG